MITDNIASCYSFYRPQMVKSLSQVIRPGVELNLLRSCASKHAREFGALANWASQADKIYSDNLVASYVTIDEWMNEWTNERMVLHESN